MNAGTLNATRAIRLIIATSFFVCGAKATRAVAAKDSEVAAPASWSEKYERIVGGPEAALVVRTGDIDNLGFGWPAGFDPFSGRSTPVHRYPWNAPEGEPAGTDRILIGSAVTAEDIKKTSSLSDGYAHTAKRADSAPEAVSLKTGLLPAKVETVLFQLFVDDFQARVFHSHFRVTLNGTPIPSFERALNELKQTGPIGKLVSLRLLPEFWPLLRSGTVELLIDDPTTHATDGYAIDFVRILVNPRPFKYAVSIKGQVTDAETHKPLPGAIVTAALRSTATSSKGTFSVAGVPAGLVVVSAALSGYDESVTTVDLVAGGSGQVTFALHPHRETAEDLARAVGEGGSAALYGLRFDFGSAKLRPDSAPALEATLALIRGRPDSRWIISGHTDNRGREESNRSLSVDRAASVVDWLAQHGVPSDRLKREGFGASRPIADNTTENGRALNRRVEIEPSP